MSGGLLEFLSDVDHQALLLEGACRIIGLSYAVSERNSKVKEATAMFARVVVCQSKAGQSGQVGTKLEEDVLPILQKQPGFVDFLTLSDKSEPERLVCVSFWTLREDAETYNRQITRSPTC